MDANTPAPAALEAQLHAARAGVAAALSALSPEASAYYLRKILPLLDSVSALLAHADTLAAERDAALARVAALEAALPDAELLQRASGLLPVAGYWNRDYRGELAAAAARIRAVTGAEAQP